MLMHSSVLEFMVKHNQAYLKQFGIPEPEVVLLRVRLIQEETAELCSAMHENDVEKVLDACADLRYVVVGTAIAYGLSSLDRFGTFSEELPVSLPSSSITKLAYISRLNRRVFTLLNVLSWFSRSLSYSELDRATRELRTFMDEVLQELTYFDNLVNVDARAVFAEVHRSNMTKAPLDKNSKGGKVDKKGFEPPNFKQFIK